ncbi:MAG: branched-chain amino acid ABC transporter permease [Deferrisomatales bacterium]
MSRIRTPGTRAGRGLAAGALLLLAAAPLLLPTYWTLILTEVLIMGLLAMGFNLLMGFTGLLSFGHAGLFGVGAYAAALTLLHGPSSVWAALGVATLASGATAAGMGYFCVRRDEIYFAMITLAFGMMLYTVAHNWIEVTGGSDGLPLAGLPALRLPGLQVSLFDPRAMYWFVLAAAALGAWGLRRVVRSPFGLLLTAIRENKDRLAFVGADVARIRLAAFVISGAVTGLAGALFCLFNGMATPDFLHWSFSARPVLMTVLGGAGTFWGPAFGSAVFFLLEQLTTELTENWMFVLGALLLPVVIFFPQGILGTFADRLARHREPRP